MVHDPAAVLPERASVLSLSTARNREQLSSGGGTLMDEPGKGVCIRIAGNTFIPALLALRSKGYRVWLEYMKDADPNSPWHPYMPD
jgi:hypothetical protein